ncbi:MAG: energy-coupled thiamine transporter ThiT [Clostridia bacterium]|nr:energy-coupled thiamine transporter ThiT [Clostridia bacterium]
MSEPNKRSNHQDLIRLTESAIMLALAIALSFVRIWKMPMGGSITLLSMLPIMLLGIHYGPVWGCGVGLLNAVFQLLMGIAGGNVFAYTETAVAVVIVVLFDYIVPFTGLGLAGLFRKFKPMVGCYIGVVLAGLLRFICHFVTGFTIWGQWAPEGMSKYYYSLIYNGQYMLPEIIMTLAASVILLQIPAIKKLIGANEWKQGTVNSDQ